MIRNSIHTFKDDNSTGIDAVAINSIIQVELSSTLITDGTRLVQLTDKTGTVNGNQPVTSSTTIQELLDEKAGAYKDIGGGGDFGGKLWLVDFEYVVGDIVVDQGIEYRCLADILITGNHPIDDTTSWRKITEYTELEQLNLIDGDLIPTSQYDSFKKILDAMASDTVLRMNYAAATHPKLSTLTMYPEGILEIRKSTIASINSFLNISNSGNDQAYAQNESGVNTFSGWLPITKADDEDYWTRGGTEWNNSLDPITGNPIDTDYKTGDSVTENGVSYVCIRDHSNERPSKVIGTLNAAWKLDDEIPIWDDISTFEPGDLAYDPTTGKNYIVPAVPSALSVHGPSGGPMNIGNPWALVTTDRERGGISHNPSASMMYAPGDIVTDHSTPVLAFINVFKGPGATPGSTPLLDTQYWQELGSPLYSANAHSADSLGIGTLNNNVLHCPWDKAAGLYDSGTGNAIGVNPGNTETTPAGKWGEYPFTPALTVGAIWTITGLGRNANDDRIKYVFTGGALIGIPVGDGDRITWVGGAPTNPTGGEIWLHTPLAEVTGERGGVPWVAGRSYQKNDLVYSGNKGNNEKETVFVCTNDHSSNDAPHTAAGNSNWKPISIIEKGGVLWKLATFYEVGDIVSHDDLAGKKLGTWRCITDNYSIVGNNPNVNNGNLGNGDWEVASATERGGVQWNPNSILYKIGDLTTHQDGIIAGRIVTWRCIKDNMSVSGNGPDVTPSEWTIASTSERGGLAWDGVSVDYKKGDLVTYDDGYGTKIIWRATQDLLSTTTNNPSPSSTDWVPAAASERGGVSWRVNVNYELGDLVTHDDAIYGTATFRCIVKNFSVIGDKPDGSSNWELSSPPERGGVAWNSFTPYVVGDVVMRSGKIYVATKPNSNATPPDTSFWSQDISGGVYVRIPGDTMTGTLIAPKVTLKANATADDSAVRAQSYATNAMGGTVKMRVAGSTLYIRNDGSNA